MTLSHKDCNTFEQGTPIGIHEIYMNLSVLTKLIVGTMRRSY